MDTITINVGGKLFVTYTETLRSIPDTKLASLTKEMSSDFDKDHNWFFFDRNSVIFESILDLYRCGSLHVSHDTCGGKVIEELDFWGIPLDRLDDCCYDVIRKYKEDTARMAFLRTKFDESVVHFTREEVQNSRLTRCREMIWSVLEYPESSKTALIYAVLYYLLVLITCMTFVLNSHPLFREEKIFNPDRHPYVDENNVTQWIRTEDIIRSKIQNPKELMFVLTDTNPVIYILDIACYIIFTIDLLVRIIVTPSKKLLLRTVVIYFDIILVITNTIAFGIEMNPQVWKQENKSLVHIYIVCKCCVILRLCRLLKLIRHLGGLKVLALSFRTSVKDLIQLALPLMITVLLMSGIMYYAEFRDHKAFPNIPITIWWCVVTMTTVGYGDVTPTTYVGYMIASFCAIFGLILVAMPVAIIASNFDGLRNINTIRENKFQCTKERDTDEGCVESTKPNKVNRIWCFPGKTFGSSTRVEKIKIDTKE